VLIKVCGLRHARNIKDVDALGVDFIGHIFYPKSPRFINGSERFGKTSALKTGVFVNEPLQDILQLIVDFDLQFVQLHGDEPPAFCEVLRQTGINLIKAFSIDHENGFENTQAYEGKVDYFLFDTKVKEHGGSGKKFNWQLLDNYLGETPFLLAGGITKEDAKDIKSIKHPKFAGVDLNSRFEIEPGLKDIEKLKQFIQEVNSI
jgi:phosphoribosylanthranilate isomerase